MYHNGTNIYKVVYLPNYFCLYWKVYINQAKNSEISLISTIIFLKILELHYIKIFGLYWLYLYKLSNILKINPILDNFIC
jgi:hypothetical protein